MPKVKKTVKVKGNQLKAGLKAMDKIIDDMIPEMVDVLAYDVEELQASNKRMGIAIWALVAYDVFFTAMLLLVIYGNQYLVK